MFHITADELPRLMNCNGSRLMPRSFPATDVDTTIRDEGIAAHHMANAVFKGADIASLINTKAPNGVFMSADMAEHVSQYLSALDCGETEVDTSFGNDIWRVGARADHISFNNDQTQCLVVDDFKYGWRIVEPDENWTLIAHAIGFCRMNLLQPRTIILRIHQPRPHHREGTLREWRLTYEQLMQYYARIDATLSNPSDMLNTGLAWCAKCHALATCPAARLASMNAIDAASMAYNDDMENDVLAFELDTLTAASEMLEARLTALKELGSHRIATGGVVPNYAREAGKGNTTWIPGLDGAFLSAITGVDLVKSGTVTPAEAKRRKVPEHVIKALTYRPKLADKLVKVDATKQARRLLNRG
jgi:hypothetical protein